MSMVFVDERLNGIRGRIAGWNEFNGGVGGSSGGGCRIGSSLFFNIDEDLGSGTGAFHVVAGAGLAFRWVKIGTYVLLLLSSSSSGTGERFDDGGLITNMWFSLAKVDDCSILVGCKGVVGTNTDFVWSKRELLSERGEDRSRYAAIARSRESNGRLGVIEDCSSSWISN